LHNVSAAYFNRGKRLGFTRGSEGITSLRKDDDGNPIEFIGVAYILSRDEREKNI
jgi:hypothetical protein